eukprot:CAMPEP_0180116724 /NCGR_PEP_ID=MMETSP0986-20121125/528_1 /TAXON_ID=697907 /ORGANISM="non described non described, Strain CCMP2293" /LENGTH=167 /DNA_ID=CAMNT_0022055531 /DNA_START=1 /DNA_END=504 /DNA_ORIENTATION=+
MLCGGSLDIHGELVEVDEGLGGGPAALDVGLHREGDRPRGHCVVAEEGHLHSVAVSVLLQDFGKGAAARADLGRVAAHPRIVEREHLAVVGEKPQEDQLLLHLGHIIVQEVDIAESVHGRRMRVQVQHEIQRDPRIAPHRPQQVFDVVVLRVQGLARLRPLAVEIHA